MFSDCKDILGDLVGDRRTADIEPRFQKIISGIAKFFGIVAQTKGRRATHSFGTIASGTLTVLPKLSIPAHKIFTPDKQYPVLLRHANIKGFPDDAIIDGRGATMRILQGDPHANIQTIDLNDYLVDVLMSTGRCFFLNNASSFSRWVNSPLDERAKMLQEFPKIIPIFTEIIRNPDSYTKLHYYSETVYLFKSSTGDQEYFMRYRLINADRSADTGFIDIKDSRLPLDFLPRLADDFRPANYLRQDFQQQVNTKGVKYLLQIQLQAVTDSKATNEIAKDCTIPWDESLYPFQDVATLDLKSIVPDEIAEGLEFNPYHGTEDLALILAHSIDETASINHLRSIVYQISANMRKYQSPSAELVDWGTPKQPSLQSQFPYAGTAGQDLPRFDPSLALPPRVAAKPRLLANIGLTALPAKGVAPELFGISGVIEIIKKLQTPNVMPANLTRCRPDKFSDEFFVERRLNGFNPGKFKRVDKKPWQYIIRYDCRKHKVKPAGVLPAVIEARFMLKDRHLNVHSIQYEMNHQTLTHSPGNADWEWSKKLFRTAEFVFQETQAHLARTHLNVEQYAMAYYRNIVNNPIRLLLEPHFEGVLNVNQLGASVIFGATGVIPEASALNEAQVNLLLKEEVARLSYKNWQPQRQILQAVVTNNYFDRAALAAWEIFKQYVNGFFATHEAEIQKSWSEIQAMSQDLVDRSILDPQYGTLAIENIQDLRQLCIYAIYHSSFVHSWVNYKQYEDGGDIEYASLGLWDSHDPAYDPISVTQRQIQQVVLAWTLSNVRYNPVMENGSPALKDLFWRYREDITPGLALDSIMMSIHI